jgi:hypothetical protein
MQADRLRAFLLAAATGALGSAPAAADYVTFGNGYSSKWDDPVHGTPATVTWGYMLDGTTVDPGVLPFSTEVTGGSDISQLRSQIDAAYGAGSFDAAIQNALDTWELVAGIDFVGPVADAGLPVGGAGATSPDIRIGAFDPSGVCCFNFVAGVGFGPPGDDLHFPDPLAGDLMLNLAMPWILPAGAEGTAIGQPGNDLENLVLHELGHAAMGLGHPTAGPGEVMYVGSDCCGLVNREPSPDDIAGAQSVYGPSAIPACSNTIDDDGDGRYDTADPGCASGSDTSERSPALLCDNGLDDDGDDRTDFDPRTFADPDYEAGEGDPGCQSPTAAKENPKCQNGLNDDLQLGTDFDGGQSISGQGNGDPNGADPQCTKPWRDNEKASGCGLGFELALALPLLAALRRRRAG